MASSLLYDLFSHYLRPALCLGCLMGVVIPASAERYWVYFGTYTGKTSQGIYVSEFDSREGVLKPATLAAATKDPSFLAIHPSGRRIYSVNEVSEFEGKAGGGVTAFNIEPGTGLLRAINHQSSGGAAPCHISISSGGNTVFVANYTGGSVAALPIHADGSLGAATTFIQHTGKGTNPQRQEAPHAHGAYVDPTHQFVLVTDLGLDKILVYRFDPKNGSLVLNEWPFATLSAGSGPRHFAFHRNGRLGYSINELNSTVTAFQYNGRKGSLTEFQTLSTLPAGSTVDSSTAEIFVHPSGKFLYGSNRGHDSIVVYAIDQRSGKLTFVQHQPTGGKTPRGFGIDPSGRWLIAGNQSSDSVTVFAIDGKTGRLTPHGAPIQVGSPVSVHFLSAK